MSQALMSASLIGLPSFGVSPAYAVDGLLIIVWDEDDLSGLLEPDEPIPMTLARLALFVSTSSGSAFERSATAPR